MQPPLKDATNQVKWCLKGHSCPKLRGTGEAKHLYICVSGPDSSEPRRVDHRPPRPHLRPRPPEEPLQVRPQLPRPANDAAPERGPAPHGAPTHDAGQRHAADGTPRHPRRGSRRRRGRPAAQPLRPAAPPEGPPHGATGGQGQAAAGPHRHKVSSSAVIFEIALYIFF